MTLNNLNNNFVLIFRNNRDKILKKKSFFVVPVHLQFHDVNEEFLNGMLYKMAPRYLGDYTTEVYKVFKYPGDKDYEKVYETLSTKCKDLKLRSELSYKYVMNYLKKYYRCIINTKPDNNSLIRSVIVQLKTPRGLTSEIVGHQLAQYMVSEVVFFPQS